jgi:rubrerythrin
MWSILANAEDTIYVFKTKIYDEIDIVPARQRLYYKGQILEDGKSLKAYDIKAEESVFMRLEKEEDEDCMYMDGYSNGMEKEIGFEESVLFGSSTCHSSSSTCTTTTTTSTIPNTNNTNNTNTNANSNAILVWVCEACTFLNEMEDQVCEMCGEAAKVK